MRAVLVTGAGKRIGRHIALALAKDGWTVAVHYNASRKAAEAVVETIREQGGTAMAFGADLMDRDATRDLVGRVVNSLDTPLTALVNNASVFIEDTAQDPHAYTDNMRVNLEAPLDLSSAFAAQTGSGVIVHMLDQRVLKPNPLYFSYTLSKVALHHAMRVQAQAFAPGIRVDGVGPGPTLRNIDQRDGEFEAEARHTLLGRSSAPEQVVDAVRYLLGAEAVTGQMIAVDSGQHLTWRTPDLVVGDLS